MKILKWAVISTSMSSIPCLNSMCQGFQRGRPKTKKRYFTFNFLQQLKKEFQFQSLGLLFCPAKVSDQEANKSDTHIFYAYLVT